MGMPRSTFYDAPAVAVGDSEILARIAGICDEFELTVIGEWELRCATRA